MQQTFSASFNIMRMPTMCRILTLDNVSFTPPAVVVSLYNIYLFLFFIFIVELPYICVYFFRRVV